MKESLLPTTKEPARSGFVWNVIILSTGFFGIALAWNTTQVCCATGLLVIAFVAEKPFALPGSGNHTRI